MPDLFYPDAEYRPGARAHYARGKTRMQLVKCHYTAGVNSVGAGLAGKLQILIGRDGHVTQFCPIDALCDDSGEWNAYGPGIEIEYLPSVDGPVMFTDAAREACKGVVLWLNTEWGIPLSYYDGPRQSTSDQTGFMSHRSLIQKEPHSDYWPQEDWDLMMAPAHPTGYPGDDEMLALCFNPERKTMVCVGIGGDQRAYAAEQLPGGGWTPFGPIQEGGGFLNFVKVT